MAFGGVVHILSAAAMAAAAAPAPRFVRTAPRNPSTWRRRFGAKNARPHSPAVVDAKWECSRFEGMKMRHRITGQTRLVWCDPDWSTALFLQDRSRGWPKFIDRTPRKALQWLLNAEVVS